MPWLHNISFPSTPSTSASDAEDSISSTATTSHSHRNNPRGPSSGCVGPRLTRQRKLRHLTDQEIVPCANAKSPFDSVHPIVFSRSPSCSSSTAPSSRMQASSPVPVPLPLPLPENSNLQSPRDGFRERTPDGQAERGSSSMTPISSVLGGRDTRRTLMDHVETKSQRTLSPDLSNKENSRGKFRVIVPIRSAPTSPFSSPVILSPHTTTTTRTSNLTDLFSYYHMTSKGNQVWSAPEMATLDIPGLPPPAFFDYTAISSQSSPLHSPPNISPRWNPRSPPVPASPLITRLSIENSVIRRENNTNIEVHPLPLPPGAVAAVPSPSLLVPKFTAKPDSTPMQCQWQKGKLIGRGTFGSVYVASNRETGALCAMKEVELFPDDPNSAECIKQLEQEIKVLSQLKHPNIVQYYGSEIVEDHFYIYLEYVHPGSINKYAREHCGAITESVVRSFTRHIVSGLAYLHSMKTIHRDIKGANLLVDASGVVKLADFGMAKHLTGQAADLSLKGSPYWMAPELMQAVMQKDSSSDLALAVDIWSLGCTIIEMFNGKPPWSEYEGAAAMFKVMRDTPPIPETMSPEGKDFLRCCFRRNPAERPSASMLLEHLWLKNSQNNDVRSSTPSINETKLTDIYYSPRSSKLKLDQLPILPSTQSTKGKVASDSENGQRSYHEASNLTVNEISRYSPRSILEVLPIVSPLHSGHSLNNSGSTSSIPNSFKHSAKVCPAFR